MPDTRVVVAADLRLDQAWPERGPDAGRELREQALASLVALVQLTREHAQALVVAGGLFDRRSVMPQTLELLGQALASLPGPVVLVPGVADWSSPDSPYATHEWPSGVLVVSDARGEQVALPGGITLWASAVTSSLSPVLDVPGPGRGAPGVHLAVLPALPEDASDDEIDAAGVAHLLVGGAGPDVEGRMRRTGSVLPGTPDDGPPRALLVTVGDGGVHTESLALPGTGPTVAVLDVSDVRSTQVLAERVQQAGRDAPVVRLVGLLRAGVLLPTTDDPSADGPVLDLTGLTPEVLEPPDDGTAAAAFLRDVLDRPGRHLDRHQASALGLRALDVPQDPTQEGA